MYYCDSETSSWATIDDLYARYGEEFIDKLSIRRYYDTEVGSYIADETKEGFFKVQSLALCDAKALILEKLSCKFSSLKQLDTTSFSAIKQWHIKVTIETLKAGGDCRACACMEDLVKFTECSSICNDDGICLPSKKTFINVFRDPFECGCESKGCCSCRQIATFLIQSLS